jgi:hypothetical protein
MMPLPSLDDYILARAAEMAATDGDVLGTVYIVGAVNTLQVELFAARDRILSSPPAPMIIAGAAHTDNVVPTPTAEAEELSAVAEEQDDGGTPQAGDTGAAPEELAA